MLQSRLRRRRRRRKKNIWRQWRFVYYEPTNIRRYTTEIDVTAAAASGYIRNGRRISTVVVVLYTLNIL